MAAFGSAGTPLAAAANRTSSAIPVPASVASGDLIIVGIYMESGGTPTGVPTGFTQLGSVFVTGANGFRAYWKRATGADTGTYTFTHASETTAGIAFRVTGVPASGTPLELLGTGTANNTNPPSAITGTTTASNELLVYLGFQNSFQSSVWTPPTGFTEQTDNSGWEISTKTQASAGSTGSVQGSNSGSASKLTTMLIGAFDAATAPKVSTLVDDFATADTTKWTFLSGATVTGGRLSCANNTNFTGQANSVAAYDLTSSGIYVEVPQAASGTAGTNETYFVLAAAANANGNNVRFSKTGTTLTASWEINGTTQTSSSVTYNATTHRWWRIQHDGTNVQFHTSPDRGTWTLLHTATPSFGLTALTVFLGAGGGSAGQVGALYDNVNNPVGLASTPADTLGGTDAATVVQAATRTPAEPLGITDSVNAGYLVPISVADTAGLTDAIAALGRGAGPADSIGATDALTKVQNQALAPAEGILVRENVVADLTYGEVQDYQFLINVQPRAPFGLGQAVQVSTFDPGSFELRAQDVDSPIGDYRLFGTDHRTPPVWSWSMWTNTFTPGDAMGWVDLLNQVWNNNVRRTPGAVVPLTYSLAGRRRVIFGRPRRFTAVPDRINMGRVHITADFSLAEDAYYDDDELSIQISMPGGFAGGSGLVIPATVPWVFTSGPSPRTETMKIAGSAPTWVSAEIFGPVANPWLAIGDLTIGLTGSVAAGQSITLSGRPWESGVRRSDGAWVPQMLDPRARLSQLRLDPGEYSVTYAGTDNTGTSRCVVSWRNAHQSL
jgi:hypothetical protein